MTIQQACDKLTELCHQGYAQARLMFISGSDVKEVENFEMLGDDTALVRSQIKWPGPATPKEERQEESETQQKRLGVVSRPLKEANEALKFTTRTRETTWQERYEKQKEINKELVVENEAHKFAARMSEKTELQLRKENTDLKEELAKWKDEWQEQVQKAIDEGYTRTLQTIQLTKAKELLNEFMRISKASDEDFEHDYSELIVKAEQFIKEIEK